MHLFASLDTIMKNPRSVFRFMYKVVGFHILRLSKQIFMISKKMSSFNFIEYITPYTTA